MSSENPATILVYVGLDRVGDGLLKLPFVRGLRDAWPHARITWLAGKETSVYAGVLAPLVDGLLDEVIEHGGVGFSPRELIGPRPLGGRRFDLVIDTQRIVWTSLVLWRVPHRRFISPAARFLLSGARPRRGYRYPKSMQRQMLDLLELATGRTVASPERLDLALPTGLRDEARALLPEGPVYVGFAPGSGGPPKCWPLDRFIAAARDQVEKGRIPVFFLGPREKDWLAEIRAAVPEARFPEQEAGIGEGRPFNPLFPMALSERLAAAVSNDSGIGHMLAIGGTRMVTLYGPTVPEKFPPMTGRLTRIRAGDYGGREMNFIPLEAVLQALGEALSETG